MKKDGGPFRPAMVIGLIAAGLVSFAAFVMLITWGGQAGGRNGGRGTALSVAAIGFKGIVDLSDDYYETSYIRRQEDLSTEDLVVIALEPESDPATVRRLLDRRFDLPTVIILPKWRVMPDPDRRGWVRSLSPDLGSTVERMLPGNYDVEALSMDRRRPQRAAGEDRFVGLTLPLPRAAQVIHGDDADIELGIAGEGALIAHVADSPHFIVADPDLFNNHGIADPARARAAVQMLGAMRTDPNGAVRFDLTVNGYGGGRSLLKSMLEPPFLAMTLALIAAAFLAGIHGAMRFGPARPPARAIPFGKAALVENSAGLVRLAKREVRLGGGYADVVRDDAARAGAAPPNLHDEALEAYLDRFTRPDEPPFSQLAYKLRSARDRHDLMSAARALFRWKKDMIR